MTPAEIFSRIDAVPTSDIKATAAKFINDQESGPRPGSCEWNQLVSWQLQLDPSPLVLASLLSTRTYNKK